MKRYTTAQAIAVLSKPGREGWYAVATGSARFSDERITHTGEYFTFERLFTGHGCNGWGVSTYVNKRSDWRIIKPKREKLRRIGTTKNNMLALRELDKLARDGSDYEIFARRVGK